MFAALKRFYERLQGSDRIDPNSTLTDEQLRVLTIGNVYAWQQEAVLNSLDMKLSDSRLDLILSKWWGIDNREEAIDTLEYLTQGTFSLTFPDLCEAWALYDLKKAFNFLKSKYDEDMLQRLWEQYNNLGTAWDDLRRKKIFKDFEEMCALGVMGWDAGRLNFVARASFNKEYISEEELWRYIQRAYDMAHSELHSWKELANSYVLGRALWNGSTDIATFAGIALENKYSPWTWLKW